MNLKITNSDLEEKILWLITVFMFSSFYIFYYYSWGKYLLAVCAAVIFVFGVLRHTGFNGKIKLEAFHFFLLLFALFCFLSVIWSMNKSASMARGFTIVQILICYSLVMVYYKRFGDIDALLSCIMWAGYVIAIYTIFSYGGIRSIAVLMSLSKRLDSQYANVNSIGMICAVACIIQYYRIIYKKKFASALLAIPAIVIVAATQSRKSIILLVIGILGLTMLRNYDKKKLVISVVKMIAAIAVAAVLLQLVLSLEMFSGVSRRMQGLLSFFTGEGDVDSSTKTRQRFIQLGIEQFFKTPFLGIGIGSTGEMLAQQIGHRTYLHNNFVELLASGGIVGFCVYYSIYVYLAYNLWKLREFSKGESDICLIILGIVLVMDYGLVSYYQKAQYFYFMVCFIQVGILKRKKAEMIYEAQKNLEGGNSVSS